MLLQLLNLEIKHEVAGRELSYVIRINNKEGAVAGNLWLLLVLHVVQVDDFAGCSMNPIEMEPQGGRRPTAPA